MNKFKFCIHNNNNCSQLQQLLDATPAPWRVELACKFMTKKLSSTNSENSEFVTIIASSLPVFVIRQSWAAVKHYSNKFIGEGSIQYHFLTYNIARNFWGRKLLQIFFSFVAIRESFLRKIWGCGILGMAIRESFLCEKNCIFHQFVEVFSIESSPLCGSRIVTFISANFFDLKQSALFC